MPKLSQEYSQRIRALTRREPVSPSRGTDIQYKGSRVGREVLHLT